MAADAAVTVRARAKLNLTLHVTGRRDDGYHELDSLVAFAEVADQLSFTPTDDLSLEISGPFAGALADVADDDNLVLRAAGRLAEALERAPTGRIHLEKYLPVAAGIGGGSADAAATLIGLARLWGEDVPPDLLMPLGLGLGADVPVCLRGRPAQMRGIGEVLDDAPALPAADLVLVNPGVQLATPDVFAARTGRFSSPIEFERAPESAITFAGALGRGRNDLEYPACTLAPVIKDALAALEDSSGCLLARMSGSGATCFGVFMDDEAAAAATVAIKSDHADWWVALTQLAETQLDQT